VLHVATGMKGRLKCHPSNRRMLDREFDDPADLVDRFATTAPPRAGLVAGDGGFKIPWSCPM
jgi:hypothetical protein